MHEIRGEALEQSVGKYIKLDIYGWKYMFDL